MFQLNMSPFMFNNNLPVCIVILCRYYYVSEPTEGNNLAIEYMYLHIGPYISSGVFNYSINLNYTVKIP